MSFLLDPPLLFASGAVTEIVAAGEERLVRASRRVAVAGFVGVSLALYGNVRAVSDRWPMFGARSGREFMLTSGLARIDEHRLTRVQHVASLSMFALYPLWFELGRAIAKR
jgi:hypothetical protein